MKKKLLVIMLVVLLIASMVVMVVACNKKPTPTPTPTPTTPNTEDEVSLKDVLNEVIGGVDKTIYEVVGNEGTESYYAATIYVDALVEEEGAAKPMVDLGVEIDIKASLAQENAAKSAALIEIKNDGEALVSVYAKGEVFYIGQNAAGADDMTWVKLQQVDGANLINGKLAEMLFGALNDLQKAEPEYKKDENGNYLDKDGKVTTKKTEYVQTNATLADFKIDKKGGFLGKKVGSILGLIGAVETLFDIQENKTADGTDYEISLLIEEIANLNVGELLKTFAKVNVDEDGNIEGLDPSLANIIDTVCQYVLGQSLKDMLTGKEAKGDVPEIKIVGGLNNDGTLKNFGLSYDYTLEVEGADPMEVAIALGVKNVKVAQAANVDFAPSDAGWEDAEDIALNAEMNITVPGKNIDADVKLVLYPALDLTFAEDKYVSFDFANVAGYVQVKNNKDATPAYATVATVDQATAGAKGFKINFTKALEALGIDATGLETDFFIPCDLADILNTAIRPQAGPDSAATLDQGTIGGINTIANSVYALVNNLMAGGAFDIGAVTGLIGPVMDLIGGIDTDALIGALITEDGELDVEQVMAEAIAIIAGLDLTKDVKFSGVDATGAYVADKALTEWLANANVFYGIAGIVNTIIYDGSDELKATYADYAAYAVSADAVTAAQIVEWVNSTIGQDAFATNDLYADLTIAAGGAGDIANNGAEATVAIKKAGEELVSISFKFSLAGENKPATGADGGFAYADGTYANTADSVAGLQAILDALETRFLG